MWFHSLTTTLSGGGGGGGGGGHHLLLLLLLATITTIVVVDAQLPQFRPRNINNVINRINNALNREGTFEGSLSFNISRNGGGGGGFNLNRQFQSCAAGFPCLPIGQCATAAQAQAANNFCQTNIGLTGVCCADQSSVSSGTVESVIETSRTGGNGFTGSISVSFERPLRQDGSIVIDMGEINQRMRQLHRLEDELIRNGILPQRNTKEFSHQNFFGQNSLAIEQAQRALGALFGFEQFIRRQQMTPEEIANSNFNIRRTNLPQTSCETPPQCRRDMPYRSIDGTCNNIQRNTAQGKAISAYNRLLPADYADGVERPRRARDGSELPNPRLVSITVAPESQQEGNRYSLLLMQFGQFIDHDLTRTASSRTQSGEQISCCNEQVLQNPDLRHPACFQMEVPDQDQFLRSNQQRCINFVRSAPAVTLSCRFGPREQMNQLTSYLDGGNIYGNSEQEQRNLRQFQGGRLRTSFINNREFLPLNPNDTGCAIPRQSEMKCFLGGDGRANEVLDLTVLHNVWLREHNRIAARLAEVNPHWDDETLYQEARRIVIAEYQHIVYNEFLPLLLGPRAYAHYQLKSTPQGHSNRYNPSVDATVLNEFATAGFRLHTQIASVLTQNTANNRVVGRLQLRNLFNNPAVLYEQGGYDMRVAGLTGQPIGGFDNFFARDMTNHLFQSPNARFGLDIVALNIQRGRDHGLQSYTRYREFCGLPPVRSFGDLQRLFSNSEVPGVMSQLYKDVNDIDLFIAGSSERPMQGAAVGPTFGCIIGEQFRRLKEGDRFWYENGDQPHPFTREQLAEIKKVTMSRILCDNTDLEIMQPIAFIVPNRRNPKLPCQGNDIPQLDLRAWAQRQ